MAVTYLTDELGQIITDESFQRLIITRQGRTMATTITAAGERLVYDPDGRTVQKLAARTGETTVATVVLRTDGDIVDTSTATVTWRAEHADGSTLTGTGSGGATDVDLTLCVPDGTTTGLWRMWVQADDETWPTSVSADRLTLTIYEDV